MAGGRFPVSDLDGSPLNPISTTLPESCLALPLESYLDRRSQLNGFSWAIAARSAKLPIPLFRAVSLRAISVNCYRIEHREHSYYKLKKVLDINSTPMKSSVYVNGVSNRRGVWRHDYEFVVVCS